MVRTTTGANYGLNSWVIQRVTAVILIIALLTFIGILIYAGDTLSEDIRSWQMFFNCKTVKIFFELTITACLYHAWVGMRDIWMDYISSCHWLRLALHVLTIVWLILCFMYATSIIWF